METAQSLICIVTGYAAIGAVVAVLFLLIGIDQIDADARGAYAFRPLLIPGVILLWPVVLWRWYELASGCKACSGKSPDAGGTDA